ncbi:hypothetical protein [Nitratireductor basaltis]|nr:hypothetical protein [Nitratireductor basaltis]
MNSLIRALAVAVLLATVSAVGAGAQNQVSDEIAARSVILSLFTISSMMEQQGAGLKGGGPVMTSFRAFLAPELIEAIASGEAGFRPLAGTREGSVDDYELRKAEKQSAGEIIFEAAVESQGKVRLISFSVVQSKGRPLITRIWGDGWSFGRVGADAAQAAPGGTMQAGLKQPPDKEQQQALAAADEGATAASASLAGAAGLSLPFQDAFDGTALGPQWTVVGEAPDKFVVEGGVIYTIATGGDDSFRKEGSENIFRLGAAPEGDFDMTLTGRLEAKTGREGVWVGLYEDATSFVAGTLHVYTSGCGPYLSLRIVNRQPVTNAEKSLTSEFDDNLFDKGPILSDYCSGGNRKIGDTILSGINQRGFSVTLSRRGFRYFATAELDLPEFGDYPGGKFTATTRNVARTTAAGAPAFMLGQLQKAGEGESVAQFDGFSISAPPR